MMISFYLLSLIPIVVALVCKYLSRKIAWEEVGISVLLSLALAGVFNLYSYNSQVNDVQTVSGRIVSATRIPRWREYYEYAVYRTEYYTATESYTDSKGKYRTRTVRKSRQVFDHWEPSTRWHDEERSGKSDINTSYEFSAQKYEEVRTLFGQEDAKRTCHTTSSHNSRQIDGDYNTYTLKNVQNGIVPVQTHESWNNRLLLNNTVYLFEELDEAEKAALPAYPISNDSFQSNRLIGAGFPFSVRQLDDINAIVGPRKKCNLIIVQTEQGPQFAEKLKSYWRGGKQNDLIVIFGSSPTAPKWVNVISWSESELCKIEIRNLVLKDGLTKNTLNEIQSQILKGWVKRDWHQFDIIKVEPLWSHVGYFLLFLFLIQGVFLYFAFVNSLDDRTA